MEWEQALERWRALQPPRHCLSISDLTPEIAQLILDLAHAMKRTTQSGSELVQFARPTPVALIFEKPSLRTRVTLEVGLYQMGGYGVYLSASDIQMGKREAVMDIARNLGRWVHAIVARVFHHGVLKELAEFSGVPVVNALSDYEHPCQALADLMTIQERKGNHQLLMAWVGDGNNVCHSFSLLSVMLGHTVRVATPEGYEPASAIVQQCERIGHQTGGSLQVMRDPIEAVAGADVVYTDVWVSMGYETEREVRTRQFTPYQVNRPLMRLAQPDAMVLHCLPAHRGEEIT
ncbi:MAG: ornithine carbamoyltransferase, partial [Fimbriimonadales bacterium]